MGNPDWKIPHGALDVAIPRLPLRILLQTVVIHGCAAILLLYLSTICPRTKFKSWRGISLQLLLYVQMPTFLLVQLGTVALGTLIAELGLMAPSWLPQYADLTRVGSFVAGDHVADVSRKSPIGMLAAVLPITYGCYIQLVAYAERFSIGYHASSDIGMLGIDHRNGWVGAVGLLTGVLTTAYRLVLYWLHTSAESEDDMEADAKLPIIFEEDERKFGDISGLPFEPSSSGNDTILGVEMTFESTAVLLEAAGAAAVHQIPLIATHRGTLFGSVFSLLVMVAGVLAILASMSSRPALAQKVKRLLLFLSLVIICWTILESTFHDLDEWKKAELGHLYSWSIRWKVTDRFDRILRTLV